MRCALACYRPAPTVRRCALHLRRPTSGHVCVQGTPSTPIAGPLTTRAQSCRCRMRTPGRLGPTWAAAQHNSAPGTGPRSPTLNCCHPPPSACEQPQARRSRRGVGRRRAAIKYERGCIAAVSGAGGAQVQGSNRSRGARARPPARPCWHSPPCLQPVQGLLLPHELRHQLGCRTGTYAPS